MRSYLNEKIAAPVLKTEINGRGNPLRWPRDTLYPQKVGINFALQTTEFRFFLDYDELFPYNT
jgi:hypothetical protein